MGKYRSVHARALGVIRAEMLVVEHEDGEWRVLRGKKGRANPLIEDLVLRDLVFDPGLNCFHMRPGAEILRLGAQVLVRA